MSIKVKSPPDPSLLRYLPDQAVVKSEKWDEWTDIVSGERKARYKIRLAVVPKMFSGTGYNPLRAFAQYVPIVDGSEKTPFICPFATYGQIAEGDDDIEVLKREVNDGTVTLWHIDPGAIPVPKGGEKKFVPMIQVLAVLAEKDYAKVYGADFAPDRVESA